MNKEACVKQDDEKNWDRRAFLQCMAWVGTRMSFHDINHPIASTDVPLEDAPAAFRDDQPKE